MSEFFTRLIQLNELGPSSRSNVPAVMELFTSCVCDKCEPDSGLDCPTGQAYNCPVCRVQYDDKGDAAECCKRGDIGQVSMHCPVCLDWFETYEEAADCCLFKHPQLTQADRELIAHAVRNGTSWSEAIAARTRH